MSKINLDYKWIIIGVLVISSLLSVQSCYNNKYEAAEQTELVRSLNDSLTREKNKKGQEVVGKTIIQADPKDFSKIQSQNKDIQELQKIVAEQKKQLGKKGAVTYVKGETVIDTFYAKSVSFKWKDSIKNKWIDWKYKVDSNGVVFKLKMNYEYAVILKEKSNGWFKKNTPYAEVVNYNPYSTTISTTTYRVSKDTQETKHLKLAPYIGYGATLIGQDLKVGPQAGFGLTYNF